MSRFCEIFRPGQSGKPGQEDRSASSPAQGRESRDVEAFVAGSPWWGRRGPGSDGTDTHRSVLAAYVAHGTRLFESAKGHFAIAIVDHVRQRVVLGVDRMGIGCLAYGKGKRGEIVFGTSALDVARHPALAAPLSAQALFDYMHFHMVPSPGSTYTGVSKIQPGHSVLLEGSRIVVERYWQPAFATSCDTPLPILREELLSTLRDAALRAMAGADSVGAFLSGGLDSSAVVGSLAAVSPDAVQTFSVGFAAEEYNELEYARIAARQFGARSVEYAVTPDHIVEAIPALARAFDEPFGNSSAVPTYFCARAAREHGIDRMLAGDGGDEIFGGNKHYSRQGIFELYYRMPGAFRRLVCENFLQRAIPAEAPFPFGKLRSYIEQARIPLPRRLHSWDFMFRTPPDTVFAADFLASINADHPDDLMTPIYQEPATSHFLDRLLFFDWQFVLADNDLRKVNTACALAGVEVRYPMLDSAVVDFSLRLSPSMKVKGQTLRPFFKAASRGFLPDQVIDKEKHGFGLPFGLWLKSSRGLADLVMATLTDLKKRRLFRADFLDSLMAKHRTGHASYYGYVIWDLVMLEQWLQAHGQALQM